MLNELFTRLEDADFRFFINFAWRWFGGRRRKQ